MSKKILVVVLSIIVLLFAIPLTLLFVLGGSGRIDEGIPDVGIDVIDVPFTGDGKDTIPITYLVHGLGDAPLITTVYFSNLPSQTQFTQRTTPDQAEYTAVVPAIEVTLPDGTVVLQADLPNAYVITYARIYALIGNDHYWSKEYIIET